MSVQSLVEEEIQTIPLPQRLILSGIAWETYQTLLNTFDERGNVRLAYDEGVLEIMTKSEYHEIYSSRLARMVEALAEEFGLDAENLGTTTFNREDLKRGFEADECFYFAKEELIVRVLSQKHKLDLAVDPPPDLIIEVDITSGSLDKFPIYASLRVPEIWHYDGYDFNIHRLWGKRYVKATHSVAFPLVATHALRQFLTESRLMTTTAMLRSFRRWVKEQKHS